MEKDKKQSPEATNFLNKPPLTHLGILFCLFVLTLLVHFPSLNGELVLDDLHTLVQNPSIKSLNLKKIWTDPSAFSIKQGNHPYRPIVVLSYTLDYKLGKGNWRFFHWTNLCLHCLVAFMVYLVLFQLAGKIAPALVVSGLFLSHPLTGFSTCYLSARSGILASLFLLLSLYFWLEFIKGKNNFPYGRLIISLLFFLLALLSKLDALCLIFMVGVGLIFSERKLKLLILIILPYLLLGFGFLVIYWWLSGSLVGASQSSMTPFYSQTQSIIAGVAFPWIYLFKIFLPVKLTIFPALPEAKALLLAFSGLGYLAVLALAIRFRKINLWLVLVWYFSALLPLVFFRLNILLAWHRGYLATVPLFLGIGLALGVLKNHNKNLLWLSLVIGFLLASLSHHQALLWRDSLKLWQKAVENAPSEFVPHNYLGILWMERGEIRKAEQELRWAIELGPDFADAHNTLGICFFKQAKFEQAKREFEKALKMDSENYIYLQNLILAKIKLQETTELDFLIQQLIKLTEVNSPATQDILKLYFELLNQK